MSLVFITDLHLDNYRPFSKLAANGMNSRLLDQMNVIKDVSKAIEKLQPEAIFFLGDLFNGMTESLPKIIYMAGYLTAQAWSQVAPLYIIVGNHDIYRGMHVLSTFESLPNVHIVSSTVSIKADGYDIDLIPWNNPLPEVHGDICAGHMEVFGAMMDAAYACKGGVQPTIFKGYKYVMLGHFHNPQSFLVPGAIDARYIGSVMQTDRRRTSEGFMGLVGINNNEIVEIPIESPRIYDLTATTTEELAVACETIDSHPKDYFRLTLTSPELSYGSQTHRVSVEYHLPEIGSSRLQLESILYSPNSTRLVSVVEKWIEQANTVLDKDELKKMAREFL